MTRKDYELIAGAFRAASRHYAQSQFSEISEDDAEARAETLRYTAHQLADRLAENNPRFDRARFIDACKGA